MGNLMCCTNCSGGDATTHLTKKEDLNSRYMNEYEISHSLSVLFLLD